ncbi:MAG: thiamine pyrophosphate-dependent enzyme, partial [Candidatus Rokuibacteriota bacterium]
LGGRRPAVLMQNSGLGTSLGALASLTLMYGLPALLLVTWRGFEGKDAPEHVLMGEITPKLLDLLGIPSRVLRRDDVDEQLQWARREMDARETPVALLVPPGVVEPGTGAGTVLSDVGLSERSAAPAPVPGRVRAEEDEDVLPVMSRREALAVALKQLGDEPVIHANGYICRESCALADRPQNFYMLGSMGLASAIGLGLALARPGRPAVVFDGDGNFLMNLGVVATVGSLRPANLVHVVFDNEVYGSTGKQPSPSREVRLDRIARAAGYRTAGAVATADALGAAVRDGLAGPGPHFVLVKVTAEEADVPRIPHTPRQIRDRFRASVGPAAARATPFAT